jgi:hypothetical protein
MPAATGPSATPRFWVEKTIVHTRPDRQHGENALGQALWSPQEAEDGKKIYDKMLEVLPDDVVFHFVDNEQLEGYSIAAAVADNTFMGVQGTAWAGRPGFRVPLRDHQPLNPPIGRNQFLDNSTYRPLIEELLANHQGLFFNRKFNLNQGSYLTEAPLKLVQIWNDIHIRDTGRPIEPSWAIPPLDEGQTSATQAHPSFWIFQGNPRHFDVDTYLRTRSQIRWQVSQHAQRIKTGDKVLIWRSGDDGGVVAECTVESAPTMDPSDDAPELWRTGSGGTGPSVGCRLQVLQQYTDNPIPRSRIKEALPRLN